MKKKTIYIIFPYSFVPKNDISNFNETHLLKYDVTGMNMYIIQIMKKRIDP